MEVGPDKIIVLADAAEFPWEIDAERPGRQVKELKASQGAATG